MKRYSLRSTISSPLFLFCLIALLVRCSPSAPPTDSASEVSKAEVNTNDETNKWRKGTLKLQLEIRQLGHGNSISNTATVTSDWDTTIVATSERAVNVAPDLRLFVSLDPNEQQRKDALQYKPWADLENPAEKSSGGISHKAHFVMKDPEAVDVVGVDTQTDETGVLDRLEAFSFNPSLYGSGYELSLTLDYKSQRNITRTHYFRKSAEPVVVHENTEESPTFSFLIYPVPFSDHLNKYSFLPESTPESLKTDIIKHHQDTQHLLQQLYSGRIAFQSSMRAGLTSEATKDKLVLQYKYDGEKQLPLMGSVETLIGKSSPNSMLVRVTLMAD